MTGCIYSNISMLPWFWFCPALQFDFQCAVLMNKVDPAVTGVTLLLNTHKASHVSDIFFRKKLCSQGNKFLSFEALISCLLIVLISTQLP